MAKSIRKLNKSGLFHRIIIFSKLKLFVYFEFHSRLSFSDPTTCRASFSCLLRLL